MSQPSSRPVHLVGSVSLSSAEDVFECVAAHLGQDVARIPDGETGERRTPFPMRPGMIHIMQHTPGIEFKRDWKVAGITLPLYGLVSGANVAAIQLGSLGFASAAIESYKDFKRLRSAGKIPGKTRMQVSMPTPFMLELIFIVPESLHDLWPAYERAMLRELNEILSAIPHEDLAIQWDMSPEFHEVIERRNVEVANVVARDELVTAVARITDAVPISVETGWHFCYGDTGRYDDDHELIMSSSRAT